MSFDRVKALFTRSERLRRKKVELAASVVKHDRLDEGVLHELREDARHFDPAFETPMVPTPDMSVEIAEGEERPTTDEPYRAWDDLLSDVFYSYHTYNHPSVRANDQVRRSRMLHRRILEQVIHSEGFEQTRKNTRLDGIGSALSTMHIADTVRELLEGELVEQATRAQEMAQHEESAEQAANANDQIREQVQSEQGGQLNGEQRQQMKANAQQRTQAQKALEELAQQQAQDPMGLDAAQAIEQAADDAKDDADAASNLPGSQTGQMKKLPPDEALKLAKTISENENVREVLKRLGRIERDMRYQRSNRVVGGREEIVDVELGNDLTRVLPSELIKLKHPLLRMDFIRRFYENSLLQYEMIGTAEAGNGPISATLDVSGSMAGAEDWWARASCLGMLSIAHRERRDFVVVEFDTQAKEPFFFSGKEPIDPAKVVEFAGRGAHGGGTDITTGMAKAAEIIWTVPAFNKADMVILTDGNDRLGDDDRTLRDELHAAGVRIHGVSVGKPSNAWLEAICDTTISAYDMAQPSDATSHLAQVLS
jgi:uncharacterized protein with von Willebrand factor type A (vWA) domain